MFEDDGHIFMNGQPNLIQRPYRPAHNREVFRYAFADAIDVRDVDGNVVNAV